MGFFTREVVEVCVDESVVSQSLSGWDGVFHIEDTDLVRYVIALSQSLSGWDGVFHLQ